jgi:hypothetical protein
VSSRLCDFVGLFDAVLQHVERRLSSSSSAMISPSITVSSGSFASPLHHGWITLAEVVVVARVQVQPAIGLERDRTVDVQREPLPMAYVIAATGRVPPLRRSLSLCAASCQSRNDEQARRQTRLDRGVDARGRRILHFCSDPIGSIRPEHPRPARASGVDPCRSDNPHGLVKRVFGLS